MIIPQQAIEFQTAAFAFPEGIHFSVLLDPDLPLERRSR
jgi:hypothetical protein